MFVLAGSKATTPRPWSGYAVESGKEAGVVGAVGRRLHEYEIREV